MPTTLLVQFPGGRYHATPWGHHVNEGLVEWPPSPWRVLRALVATAFTKLGEADPLPQEHALRGLVSALSTAPPSYIVPFESMVTHTRHYMPLGNLNSEGRPNTSLILDACVRPGHEALAITWPADLNSDLRAYLARLADAMGYLGRAESWVKCRLLETEEPLPVGRLVEPCRPHEPSRPEHDQINMLAPVQHDEYAKWRELQVEQVLARLEPLDNGKKQTKKSQDLRSRALSPYPNDLFSCLTRETRWMKEHGWSQPPGTQRQLYWRPSRIMATGRVRMAAQPKPLRSVEAILIALASDTSRNEVLPLFSRCLPQAELLHRALVARAGRGQKVDCPCLTGKDPQGMPLTGHRHNHILPLCLDEPGRVDHLLLWAPMGFDDLSQRVVFSMKQTYTKGDENPLFVTVAGSGDLELFRPMINRFGDTFGMLDTSDHWTSLTPFVPPRHIKKTRHSLVDQVLAELRERGFDGDVEVRILDKEVWAQRKFHRFVRVRREPAAPPPQDVGLAIDLVFRRPVKGPIAIGYGSHFGLGLFRAV